jgi:hypothetical protein
VASPKREPRVLTVAEGGAEDIGLARLPRVSTFTADGVAGTCAELKAGGLPSA